MRKVTVRKFSSVKLNVALAPVSFLALAGILSKTSCVLLLAIQCWGCTMHLMAKPMAMVQSEVDMEQTRLQLTLCSAKWTKFLRDTNYHFGMDEIWSYQQLNGSWKNADEILNILHDEFFRFSLKFLKLFRHFLFVIICFLSCL